MTRSEITSMWTVKDGRIRSPGRFEGQKVYVPHYWDLYLNGFSDRDDGHVLGFDVQPEDREEFPELGRKRTVRLVQTDQGFVEEV